MTADAEAPVDGVVVIEGPRPGPRVGVLGAVHGDERCGLEAIQALEADLRAGRRHLYRGSVVLVHGNPAATAEGRRYTRGGVDLNRQFDFRFVDDLPPERWSPEHHRAIALRPVLESLDAVLDLHSTTAPGEPFAIVDPEADASEIATRVGPEWVVTRWRGASAIPERTSIGVFRRLRRPALVVECGDHASPATFAFARRALDAFLCCIGVVDGPPPEARPTRRVTVVDSLVKTDPGFRFARPLVGFSRLEAGEPLGARPDGSPDLDGPRAPDNCWAVLPNDRVPVGDDLLFFAQDDEHEHRADVR